MDLHGVKIKTLGEESQPWWSHKFWRKLCSRLESHLENVSSESCVLRGFIVSHSNSWRSTFAGALPT